MAHCVATCGQKLGTIYNGSCGCHSRPTKREEEEVYRLECIANECTRFYKYCIGIVRRLFCRLCCSLSLLADYGNDTIEGAMIECCTSLASSSNALCVFLQLFTAEGELTRTKPAVLVAPGTSTCAEPTVLNLFAVRQKFDGLVGFVACTDTLTVQVLPEQS